MRRATSLTLSIFALTAFATVSVAQGRHDEKPHGMTKPPPTATQQQRSSGTAGRHDEGATTHGKKKPAATKKDAPAGGDPTTAR